MRSNNCAADVPLICDPVPGGDVVGPHFLTKRELSRVKLLWHSTFVNFGMDHSREVEICAEYLVQPLPRQRAEWPDAEFCAA